VRDTVFLTVEKGGVLTHLNFIFNAWGNKYDCAHDNALNHKLANAKFFKGKSHQDIDFILEGGSVESDGIDTILTTRQCLLNPNRNHGLTQAEIEQHPALHFGAKRVLWVDQDNLSGDDTDAHIDTLARFCSADTIAYTSCDDSQDPHYASLQRMAIQLRSFETRSGEPYKLVPLPLPKAVFDEEGQQLPANYANFLIINHAVLVPVYGDANDAVAKQRIGELYPKHHIIGIPCLPLVQQYGSLHCMTMQFPEAL
jgi:agmatine/peptidylarginine deiminase